MQTRTRTTHRATAAVAAVCAVVLLASCGTAKVEVTGKAKSLASDAATATLDTPVRIGASPSTTATTTVPTTDVPGGERSDDAFCAAAADLVESGFDSVKNFTITGTDRRQFLDQLKAVQGDVDDAIRRMDQTAPSAIAPDMHTLATEMEALTRSIDADQDVGDLLDSMATIDGSTIIEAGERVSSYLAGHCGFSLQGTATR